MTNFPITFLYYLQVLSWFYRRSQFSIVYKLIQNFPSHSSPYSLKIITIKNYNKTTAKLDSLYANYGTGGEGVVGRGLIYYQVKRQPLDIIF